MTFAEKILQFNKELASETLNTPKGISVMNPFKGKKAEVVQPYIEVFYRKFYSDNNKRYLILGINPGRHGAGITGIPFSDTKRLAEKCGIEVEEFSSHEPSSVFVYDVIERYGGVEKFYNKF